MTIKSVENKNNKFSELPALKDMQDSSSITYTLINGVRIFGDNFDTADETGKITTKNFIINKNDIVTGKRGESHLEMLGRYDGEIEGGVETGYGIISGGSGPSGAILLVLSEPIKDETQRNILRHMYEVLLRSGVSPEKQVRYFDGDPKILNENWDNIETIGKGLPRDILEKIETSSITKEGKNEQYVVHIRKKGDLDWKIETKDIYKTVNIVNGVPVIGLSPFETKKYSSIKYFMDLNVDAIVFGMGYELHDTLRERLEEYLSVANLNYTKSTSNISSAKNYERCYGFVHYDEKKDIYKVWQKDIFLIRLYQKEEGLKRIFNHTSKLFKRIGLNFEIVNDEVEYLVPKTDE